MPTRRAWGRVLQWSLVAGGVAMLAWTQARRQARPGPPLAGGLPAAMRGKISILVLFQPKDCGSYGNYLQALGALAASDSIPVLGVPIHAGRDPAKLREAFPGLDPPFPLQPALGRGVSTLLSRMGYHLTPVAVLVDPGGRPLMVIPPHPVPYQQAELARAVQTYVRSIRAGGMLP